MLIAITRAVSASLAQCQLTHLSREPIDVARARRQHDAYEATLTRLGATVRRAAGADDLPDAVFVEDTAVVLDDVAVITRPGAESRRPETAAVAAVLAEYLPLITMTAPSTLDGGDVLRLGRTLYVGRSSRSNAAGISQLAEIAKRHGIAVVPVDVGGCLHLKSAATAISEDAVLINPAWVDAKTFAGAETIAVDEREPLGANALRVGDALVYGAQFPRTRERLEARGYRVEAVDCDELAKAEGAVTCCSVLVPMP